MKFTPKEISENVNISTTKPLHEFFILCAWILGALLLLYWILGFALDIIVDRLPTGFEQKLGLFFSKHLEIKKEVKQPEAEIQRLLTSLQELSPPIPYELKVRIVEEKHANALALPGGLIIVYSGLLDKIKTENELGFVLAHEIGHYIHRDHLRGLGRGLVLAIMSSSLFGPDNAFTNLLMRTMLTTDRTYSRRQEAAADMFALELLNKKYGHVAGLTEFFDHLREEKKQPRFIKFFSTHPLYEDRISLIEQAIANNGYIRGTPLPYNTEKSQ